MQRKKGSNWIEIIIKMVNEFKLTVVHFARPNPMQICACSWIYRWTKRLWKIRIGPLGRGPRTADRRAFGPSGRRAAGPPGRRAAGPSRAVGRGPWAVGRGPLGHGPAFSKTLKTVVTRETLGSDGLPAEFYKVLWNDN